MFMSYIKHKCFITFSNTEKKNVTLYGPNEQVAIKATNKLGNLTVVITNMLDAILASKSLVYIFLYINIQES